MNDIEFLEAKVRGLEATVRMLQKTLRDEFAKAALTGMLANHGLHPDYVENTVKAAFEVADVAMEVRKCPR